jgi:hypothetical protein
MISHMSRHDNTGLTLRQGTFVGFRWLFRDADWLQARMRTPQAEAYVALLANAWCVFEAEIASIREKCTLTELQMDFRQIALNRGRVRSDAYTNETLIAAIQHELRTSKLCKVLSASPDLVAAPKRRDNRTAPAADAVYDDVLRHTRLADLSPHAIDEGLRKMSTSGDYWGTYWQREEVGTQSVLNEFMADFGFKAQ